MADPDESDLDALDEDVEEGRITLADYWERRADLEAGRPPRAPVEDTAPTWRDAPAPPPELAPEARGPARHRPDAAAPPVSRHAPGVGSMPAPPRSVRRHTGASLTDRVTPWARESTAADGATPPATEAAGPVAGVPVSSPPPATSVPATSVPATSVPATSPPTTSPAASSPAAISPPSPSPSSPPPPSQRPGPATPTPVTAGVPRRHARFAPSEGAVNLAPERPTPVADQRPARRWWQRRPGR